MRSKDIRCITKSTGPESGFRVNEQERRAMPRNTEIRRQLRISQSLIVQSQEGAPASDSRGRKGHCLRETMTLKRHCECGPQAPGHAEEIRPDDMQGSVRGGGGEIGVDIA